MYIYININIYIYIYIYIFNFNYFQTKILPIIYLYCWVPCHTNPFIPKISFSNSSYCLLYSSYGVSWGNLVLDQLTIPLSDIFLSSHSSAWRKEKFFLGHPRQCKGLMQSSLLVDRTQLICTLQISLQISNLRLWWVRHLFQFSTLWFFSSFFWHKICAGTSKQKVI